MVVATVTVGAARWAVPGGGSYCGGRRCAPTPLRCSRHEGGCGTAVRGAERAANFTASSPVRRLRRRTPPHAAGLAGRAGPCGRAARQAQTVPRTVCVRARLLAAPQVAPTGHRPPRSGARGLCRRMPRCCRQGCGRADRGALGGRRAAQRTKGHRDAPKRVATASMSSSEHRHDARAPCRPCEGEGRSRPWAASSAGDLGPQGRGARGSARRPARPQPCILYSTHAPPTHGTRHQYNTGSTPHGSGTRRPL